MTRWSKCFLAGIVFTLSLTSQAQEDYFNHPNSLKYAQYLIQNHDFELAFKELDRIVVTWPEDTTAVQLYLSAATKSKHYPTAIQRYEHLYRNERPSEAIQHSYYTLLFLDRRLDSLSHLFTQLNEYEYPTLRISAQIVRHNWEDAGDMVAEYDPIESMSLLYLIQYGEQKGRKKPWLAATMSTIVPGTGKIYTGYWKDALFSMLVVGTSAWQAYRGFEKKGSTSAYPWIYVGLGTGFYLGNIYGSHKSAHTRNRQTDQYINEKLDALYLD